MSSDWLSVLYISYRALYFFKKNKKKLTHKTVFKTPKKCSHATRRRLEAREIRVLRAKYAHKIRNLEAKNAQLLSENNETKLKKRKKEQYQHRNETTLVRANLNAQGTPVNLNCSAPLPASSTCARTSATFHFLGTRTRACPQHSSQASLSIYLQFVFYCRPSCSHSVCSCGASASTAFPL